MGVAVANFTEHPTTISSGMIAVTTNLTYFFCFGSISYLNVLLGLLMWRLRIVGWGSLSSSARCPRIRFVILLF